MPIRDDEILRLIKYAEGMGVKVKFLSSKNHLADAEWTLDGTEINVYRGNSQTKTDIILSLIHEIGHHVWFIHKKNRQPDLKFEEALDRQNLFDSDLSLTPAPKKFRKKILDTEQDAIVWWDVIYKDTNLKIPLWKLEVAKRFDIWAYEVYYKTGFFPSRKDKKIKHKELTTEIKNK